MVKCYHPRCITSLESSNSQLEMITLTISRSMNGDASLVTSIFSLQFITGFCSHKGCNSTLMAGHSVIHTRIAPWFINAFIMYSVDFSATEVIPKLNAHLDKKHQHKRSG